ncbi:hypothetical protein [Fusobacterium sp.]|uniref:hypothetical protein n=1 Tax=Fusobacterium sp. TaxID=68766 RepID=UPI0029028A64|nr:hypothetical protein [Fusobacterium sp.]MDU1912661.1 hypothetical protein [Fusobacterium sp.]
MLRTLEKMARIGERIYLKKGDDIIEISASAKEGEAFLVTKSGNILRNDGVKGVLKQFLNLGYSLTFGKETIKDLASHLVARIENGEKIRLYKDYSDSKNEISHFYKIVIKEREDLDVVGVKEIRARSWTFSFPLDEKFERELTEDEKSLKVSTENEITIKSEFIHHLHIVEFIEKLLKESYFPIYKEESIPEEEEYFEYLLTWKD